ncbi:STAS domain-containing protein [Hydrogenovibrio kuenenii]|uniref:STAS domain-containing protein n=1 Tax=Hydrogenovibrio kuenenii TaxID=63658 RepID=UPI000570037C|nr:STAS domain-containing protein [Hydrogenovibrio kuenenii]
MSQQTAYVVKDKRLTLTGDLTVQSISKLFKNNAWVGEGVIEEIDCSLVTSADSSCLALILFLQAKAVNKIRVYALPEDLSGLIDLYELAPLLSASKS